MDGRLGEVVKCTPGRDSTHSSVPLPWCGLGLSFEEASDEM